MIRFYIIRELLYNYLYSVNNCDYQSNLYKNFQLQNNYIKNYSYLLDVYVNDKKKVMSINILYYKEKDDWRQIQKSLNYN